MPQAGSLTDFQLLSSSFVMQNFLREIIVFGRIIDLQRSRVEDTVGVIRERFAINLNR